MKQVKVGDKLYVLDNTPYEITEDTDASMIYVPADSYNGYVEMNSYLSYITPYNYNAIKCNEPEFVAFTDIIMTDESNPAAMTVMYNKGLAKSSYYMTRGEAEMVNNSQLDGLFTGNTSISYFNEFSYFTGITKIGTHDDSEESKSYAPFRQCTNLKEITLPKSVNEIGSRAFDLCKNVDKINGLEKVTKFNHCSLQATFASNSSMNIDTLYVDKLGGDLQFNNVYKSNYTIKNIVINEGITYIPQGAFLRTYNTESIKLPQSLKTIGYINTSNGAFLGCYNLKRLNSNIDGVMNIPNRVKTIGWQSFYCKNNDPGANSYITNINIPDSVSYIGNAAFDGFIKCDTLNIGSGITYIGGNAFNSVGNAVDEFTMTIKATTPPSWDGALNNVEDITIYVPAESVDDYKSASGWSNYASYIYAIEE